jgi:hypothetical protein
MQSAATLLRTFQKFHKRLCSLFTGLRASHIRSLIFKLITRDPQHLFSEQDLIRDNFVVQRWRYQHGGILIARMVQKASTSVPSLAHLVSIALVELHMSNQRRPHEHTSIAVVNTFIGSHLQSSPVIFTLATKVSKSVRAPLTVSQHRNLFITEKAASRIAWHLSPVRLIQGC